jgi:hypothetical protein
MDTDHAAPAYASYRQIDWLLPLAFVDNVKSDSSASTKVVHTTQESQEQCQSALDFLGLQGCVFQTLQQEVPEVLHFHEDSFTIQQLPGVSAKLLKHIIWEINELCFWSEFQLLDRQFNAHHCVTPEMFQMWDNMVTSVFNTSSLLSVADHILPRQPEFLISKMFKICRGFLEVFHIMLSTWPGFPTTLDTPMPTVGGEFFVTESQLVDCYLQTSYKFLGHCPSVSRVAV